MSSEESLIDNGKNKFSVYCQRCQSKILNPGMGQFTNDTYNLPLMQVKGECQTNGEAVTGYWKVADMFTFENLGFSNTVDNLKYLICADCEIGPIGLHNLSTKESYVALERVKHS